MNNFVDTTPVVLGNASYDMHGRKFLVSDAMRTC